jgi:hypothetical protein
MSKVRSRDSLVATATSYGLDDRGAEVRVQLGSKISTLNVVQIGSGTHPASYTTCIIGSLLGGKADGA